MKLNVYNIKAITDVYKNAHIALQSISDMLPSVKDASMKNEFKDQYEGYEKLIGEISTFMKENSVQPKDINVFKKAMLWSSIKMKTLFDDSKNQAAEMMIKGTEMGIIELTAMKNEGENLTSEILDFLDRLLALEESYRKRLMKFL